MPRAARGRDLQHRHLRATADVLGSGRPGQRGGSARQLPPVASGFRAWTAWTRAPVTISASTRTWRPDPACQPASGERVEGAKAVATCIAGLEDLATTEPEPVEIGGLSGYVLDVKLPPATTGGTSLIAGVSPSSLEHGVIPGLRSACICSTTTEPHSPSKSTTSTPQTWTNTQRSSSRSASNVDDRAPPLADKRRKGRLRTVDGVRIASKWSANESRRLPLVTPPP